MEPRAEVLIKVYFLLQWKQTLFERICIFQKLWSAAEISAADLFGTKRTDAH